MEHKLRVSSRRGAGWYGCSPRHLLHLLLGETNELSRALRETGGDGKRAAKPEEIAKECADVANFAMMIADNVYLRGMPVSPPRAKAKKRRVR